METQCSQPQYLTLLNKICAHNPSASLDNQAKLSNSLAFPCPPDPWEYVMKKSAADLGEQDFPVKWFKFINPSSKPRMTETSICTLVHVAYSPLASMSHNLHDRYPSFHTLIPVEYIPPSIPTLCNQLSTLFHFGVDYLHPTKGPHHDLPSMPPPTGEMTSFFSWTSLFKSPTPRTLYLGDPTLSRINQVISVSMFEMCFVPLNLQPSHSIPRLGLVCIFKKKLLHLQLMNHHEILMKPQTQMNSSR